MKRKAREVFKFYMPDQGDRFDYSFPTFLPYIFAY